MVENKVDVSNPGDPDQGGPRMRGHIKVFDGNGGVLLESATVEIGAGEFHSFDVERSDILQPGEPRTGRIQLRIQIVIVTRVPDHGEAINARIDRLPTFVELIDTLSGKTMAMLLPAVQKVRDTAR